MLPDLGAVILPVCIRTKTPADRVFKIPAVGGYLILRPGRKAAQMRHQGPQIKMAFSADCIWTLMVFRGAENEEKPESFALSTTTAP